MYLLKAENNDKRSNLIKVDNPIEWRDVILYRSVIFVVF